MTPDTSPSSVHTPAVQLQRAAAPTSMMALSSGRSLVETVLFRTDLGQGNSNYSDQKIAGAGVQNSQPKGVAGGKLSANAPMVVFRSCTAIPLQRERTRLWSRQAQRFFHRDGQHYDQRDG